MRTIGLMLSLVLLASSGAHAQSTARLRGTITAVEGNVLSVRSREGENLKLQMPDNIQVGVAKAVRFEDLRQGDYVGATTRKQPDGSMEAIEVHYLPATAASGQLAWDLEPDTTMTNANIASTGTVAGKRELALDFKGGSQKVIVPPSTPVVRTVPGTRADLKPGEYVFVSVQKSAEGVLTAQRVQVSMDGVKPPQ